MKNELSHDSTIFSDIKTLIEQSRQQVAIAVNATITMLYWQVGKRIDEEILGGQRADHGKSVIQGLSEQLTVDYGKGWSKNTFGTASNLPKFLTIRKLSTRCVDN